MDMRTLPRIVQAVTPDIFKNVSVRYKIGIVLVKTTRSPSVNGHAESMREPRVPPVTMVKMKRMLLLLTFVLCFLRGYYRCGLCNGVSTGDYV